MEGHFGAMHLVFYKNLQCKVQLPTTLKVYKY